MMWARVSIALLCCWAGSASAADPWCRPGGAAALRFAWVPASKADPSRGSVRIEDAAGKTVQVLDKLYNDSGSSESFSTRRDFNNDGCPDLVVTSDVAAIGNESATVFLYQPGARRFEPSQALSNIGGLDLDPRDRNCVTGFWKGGDRDIRTETHCWRKGKLVLMREYSVYPVYNRENEMQCFLHIETEYRGGKKHTRERCSQEF